MSNQTGDTIAASSPPVERLAFALRQAALLAVALLVAGLVTNRLHPDQTIDRGIASTPFLWAIVVWCALLVFHARAFQHSQMHSLEGPPLIAGLAAGALVFLTGLFTLDGGSAARRLIYLFANAMGALLFWWGAVSLGYLIVHMLSRSADSSATRGQPQPG